MKLFDLPRSDLTNAVVGADADTKVSTEVSAATAESSAGAPPRQSNSNTPAVRFTALSKHYEAASGRVTALSDIDFQIKSGEVFGIIGRSGAGKSTLLRTINRLESPSSGQVRVHGNDIGPLDEDGLVSMRRGIGMIFQHFNLMSAKTVAQNIALPLRVAGVKRADIAPRVDFLLKLVGLSDKRDVYPAKLSGGQKQRVGIARALVHEPAILLCDEATSALDPETTQSILALLRDINRRLGLTIILITHEMAVIRETCDRVAVLEKGKVVELGEVWKVFGNPQHPATQALLQPLVHDLPDELRTRLEPALPDAPLTPTDQVLLDFRLTGETGHEFDLGALSRQVDGSLELLHGGVDRLRGRAHGRVVVGVRTRLPDVAALRAAVVDIADQVHVLGLYREDTP